MPSTTTRPLLNASPLQILEHAFTKVEVRANKPFDENASASLKCQRSIEASKEAPDIWLVSLEVSIDSIEASKPINYAATLAVTGKFRIREGFPNEKKIALMEVTAATILYGCCREMLATVTGRCENGMVSLPSITFVASEHAAESLQPSAASPQSKKRASRKTKKAQLSSGKN